MPRRTSHLLRWSPITQSYEILIDEKVMPGAPAHDSEAWRGWLATLSSFAFHSVSGDYCTVRKEKLRRGGEYWYGYRGHNGRTKKCYIGKAETLSLALLEQVATELAAVEQATSLTAKQASGNRALQGVSQVGSGENEAASILLPIVESRLHPPRLPSLLIERSRLLARLDDARSHKLTVITAPAGSGKTTLVSQWATNQAGPAVAWVTLESADNDPIRFWRCVIAACRTVHTHVGERALNLLFSAMQPPFDQPAQETVLTLLLNDIMHTQREMILVLEDYHLVTEERIDETLTFFIDHLPAGLHVILLTRRSPTLPLVRWRARGDLRELHATDLRFSCEETKDFFKQALPGLAPVLSDMLIRQLDARLNGWPVGLRLMALTLQAQTQTEKQLQALTKMATDQEIHRPVMDYFVSEVLQTQSPIVQCFLLQTSIPGRLTGSLCDALTGKHNGAEQLVRMERAGLFLEALDEQGTWYRYHALFAEAMRGEAMRRFGEEALRTLSRQASAWYETHDLPMEAIEAALYAGDLERVASLIERLYQTETVYEYHMLRRWLEQMPIDFVHAHPTLCWHYARALFFTKRADDTEVEKLFQIEEALHLAEEGWRAVGNTVLLGELYIFQAMLNWRLWKTSQAAKLAKQALALLPGENTEIQGQKVFPQMMSNWHTIGQGIVASDYIGQGQFDKARHLALELYPRAIANKNRNFARIMLMLLGSICREQGELHLAGEYFRQTIVDAKEQDDQEDIAFSLFHLAELSLEWNDCVTAEQQVREASGYHVPYWEVTIPGLTAYMQARFAQVRGESARALQEISSLCMRLQALPGALALRLLPTAFTWLVRIQLANGDLTGTGYSLDILANYHDDLSQIERERVPILRARLLLAQGEYQETLQLLEKCLERAQELRYTARILEIQVLMALTCTVAQQTYQARQWLRQALSLARGGGYIRLFLDEGEALLSLLRSLLPSLQEKALRTYAQQILRASTATVPISISPEEANDDQFLEALSSQEQRVLRLLTAGRTNPEIARELVVSVNTVKDHVKNVYRKLNVRNRLEASEAARRQKLI